MKTVALLPIKAHSERVPGKNFKSLGGKPLFRWITDQLLKLKEVDVVVINTDALDYFRSSDLMDEERVIFRERGKDLLGDFTSMNLIIEDDIKAVEADRYIMTHVTNPFLSRATMSQALQLYEQHVDTNDSLFTVTRCQERFYWSNGRPVNHDPRELLRTQDLIPLFAENSCLYVFSRRSFADAGARIGRKPYLMDIPKLEAIDIDDPQDWQLAEAVANQMHSVSVEICQ